MHATVVLNTAFITMNAAEEVERYHVTYMVTGE